MLHWTLECIARSIISHIQIALHLMQLREDLSKIVYLYCLLFKECRAFKLSSCEQKRLSAMSPVIFVNFNPDFEKKELNDYKIIL
jgi:hypothetical protein